MVKRVVELLTSYLGAHEVLVAARVELGGGFSSTEIANMSSEIDRQCCARSTRRSRKSSSTPHPKPRVGHDSDRTSVDPRTHCVYPACGQS